MVKVCHRCEPYLDGIDVRFRCDGSCTHRFRNLAPWALSGAIALASVVVGASIQIATRSAGIEACASAVRVIAVAPPQPITEGRRS